MTQQISPEREEADPTPERTEDVCAAFAPLADARYAAAIAGNPTEAAQAAGVLGIPAGAMTDYLETLQRIEAVPSDDRMLG